MRFFIFLLAIWIGATIGIYSIIEKKRFKAISDAADQVELKANGVDPWVAKKLAENNAASSATSDSKKLAENKAESSKVTAAEMRPKFVRRNETTDTRYIAMIDASLENLEARLRDASSAQFRNVYLNSTSDVSVVR